MTEIYNTIYHQKLFHEKDIRYKESTPDIYLTKLINNYFKTLSIIYKYPFKFKWNSILYDFDINYELINDKQFKLNVNKGLLSLDNTLIEIKDSFQLQLDDISISNYKYCNILFVVDFDFYEYVKDHSKTPIFKLYLYDSITGMLYNPDNNFNIFDSIILETFSVYYKNENFIIKRYDKRLNISDIYDKMNYIDLKPQPPVIPKPYPNVTDDIPNYIHDHKLLHSHCFAGPHDHGNNLNQIQKYYSEPVKIFENTIPPPTNIINNILSLDLINLGILDFEYPILLELFNKCNLEIANINNLSFDFRYVDPYQDILDNYNKDKYNYSRLINYSQISKNHILINYNSNNSRLLYPIRTENYWIYLMKRYCDFYDIINSIDNNIRFKYIFEDNIINFGCFCPS